MANILILDDDKEYLNYMKWALKDIENVNTTIFSDAESALNDAKENHYDMVISDYRMPEMDGITFLRKFKDLHPNTARVIISSFCDRETLYGAINEAQAVRYIEKPCHNEIFSKIISELLQERQLVYGQLHEMMDVIHDQEMLIEMQQRQDKDE